MRGANLGDPPELLARADLNRVMQTREYRLITPLFGGGVRPGEADPVTTVRGSTVRGQLRFWWRATRGGHYGNNLAKLKQAEDLLWGAASTPQNPRPALVDLSIMVTDMGQDEPPYEVVQNANSGRFQVRPRSHIAPSYAAFPLQPKQEALAHWEPERDQVRTVRVGVRFCLTLAYPERWEESVAKQFAASPADELAAALWAWETFGGIGARTRRGFGALELLGVDGQNQPHLLLNELKAKLTQHLQQHVVTGAWPTGVPHLPRTLDQVRIILRLPRERAGWDKSNGAWNHLIEQLSKFRQWRDPPAPSKPNQPGRSRWPEPDALRRQARSPHPYHRPRLHIDKYPRAVFGLPIVIHFKDRGDPEDYTVQGADASFDRMASQLIVRPLVCSDGKRTASVGIAVILEGPRFPPVGIGVKAKSQKDVEPVNGAGLIPEEVASITALAQEPRNDRAPSPLADPVYAGGEVDLLMTFLNYLER